MEENGKGYITVNVRTAGGALPVEGALITVSDDSGTVISAMISGISGDTDILELSAPSRENSMSPENGGAVSSYYSVDADKAGYYHAVISNIPIFDGVTSIQQVLLIPLAPGDNPLEENDLTRFSVGGNANL